jgi:hypothetical protein
MSRPSSIDARYQWYADGEPETAESVERGFRVLHCEFAEDWNPRGRVVNLARLADKSERPPRGRSR